MKRLLTTTLFALAVAMSTGAAPAAESGFGEMSQERNVPAAWSKSIGAQLYDDWPRVLLRPGPFTKHPLWQRGRAPLPSETWRCVNCHGWDLRGSDGVGGDLGRVAGVPGLRHLAGQNRWAVRDLVLLKGHGFEKGVLTVDALNLLVGFLVEGQTETAALAAAARTHTADLERGAMRFATVCSICHGPDGTDLNLGTERRPQSVSSVAKAMPWRFIHAVQFGHGGTMPSFRHIGDEDILDLLVFAARELARD